MVSGLRQGRSHLRILFIKISTAVWKVFKSSSTGLKRAKSSKCERFIFVAFHLRLPRIMEIMSSTSEGNNTCTSLIGSAGIFAHSEGGKVEFTCLLKSTAFLKNFASDNIWQLVWKCTYVKLQECRLILAGRGFKNTAERKEDNLISGNALWADIKKEKVGSYYSFKSRQRQQKSGIRIRMLVLVERADQVCKSLITHSMPQCYC